MRPALLSTALMLAIMAAPAAADRGRRHRSKPSAPVTLTITAAPGADGTRVVVLDAVPTRDVPAVELEVAGQSARFGATRAGEHRTLEARIPAAATDDIIGAARVGATSATGIRSRTVALRFAPVAAEKSYTVVTVKGRWRNTWGAMQEGVRI